MFGFDKSTITEGDRQTMCGIAVVFTIMIAIVSVADLTANRYEQQQHVQRVQAERVQKQKHKQVLNSEVQTWHNLNQQNYVTIDQFKVLFNRVKKHYNTKLADEMNLAKVVDDSDGHVYMANIDANNMTLKLTPLQNGKRAMVSQAWQKEHTK